MFMILHGVFWVLLLAITWFWVRTLIIMNRENILFAIGGFFIAPVVQFFFFLSYKDTMDSAESAIFKKYFMFNVSLFLLWFALVLINGSV